MLIVFAGLPGTGKSSIARSLAQEIGAVWLRIDTIEQAIRNSRIAHGPIEDAGYRAAHAVAEDNLRVGLTVIADSVNPWMLTRNAWRDVGTRAGVPVLELEMVCSDAGEHRRRIETRPVEVPGLNAPDWRAVIQRDYRAWDRNHITIDTAGRSIADCVAMIQQACLKDPDGLAAL